MSSAYIQRLRAALGHEKVIAPAVLGILQGTNGRVLLQERTDLDIWALPGGYVEIGESATAALKREVQEETGLTPLSAGLVGLYSDPQYDFTYPNGDQVQHFLAVFHVPAWEGELSRDDAETKDIGFFDPARLPERTAPFAREILEDFLRAGGRVTVK